MESTPPEHSPQLPPRGGFHPLLRASGVDPADAIMYGETGRYSIFGALVLFTTAMSATVAFAAVSIATDAPLLVAVAAAALWGFGIFHIDRWLVSAHIERDGIWHRAWLLVPRLAIAVPMGLLVAWFAMLGIADHEIQQQLDANRQAAKNALSTQVRQGSDLARQRQVLVDEKTALQARHTTAEARIQPLQDAYDAECAGTGGTRSKGCGPVAQAKFDELTTAKQERDQARDTLNTRQPEIDKAITALDQQISASVAEVSQSTDDNDGVFARRAALSQVLARDADARNLYLLLEIVLVVVDVIPAVAKVVSPISMVDIARTVRRRRLREELEAGADAERGSQDVVDALAYAATQRAAVLRARADMRRTLDSRVVPNRPHRVGPGRRRRPLRSGVAVGVVAVLAATLASSAAGLGSIDRSGPIKEQTRLTATVANGGDTELALDGGGRLLVPAGAIDVGATVTAVPAASTLPGSTGQQPVGKGWEFNTQPAGALHQPVTLELPLPTTGVDAATAAADYRIATFDEATGAWVGYPGTYDPARNVVVAKLPHFSTWQVWTWDWAGIAASVNQYAGQLINKRAGPAPCTRGQPVPNWVADVIGVTNDAAIAVRGCTEGEGDVLAVELVNNRPYGQVLTYGSAVKWGWIQDPGSALDVGRNAFMKAVLGDGKLYLPPLSRASVGITRPAAGRTVPFSIQLTGWSLTADILTMVASKVVELGAGKLGERFRWSTQHVAQLKACSKWLIDPLGADDLASLGAVHAFLTNDLLPCVEAAFVNLIRDGINLGALNSAELEQAQRLLGKLKTANRVGAYLQAYDLEWRLLDIFIDTKLVGGVAGIGNGFSVRTRSAQGQPTTNSSPATTTVGPAPTHSPPTSNPTPTQGTTTPPAAPPTTTPPPPPQTRGFTVADSYYHGTWARTGSGDGTWYPQGTRPPNARYWFPNGLGVAVDCVAAGAAYPVRFLDGRRETWTWWAHVTDNTWVPIAVFQEIWLDGANGMPTC